MRYVLDDLRIDEESGVVCVGIIDLDDPSSDALSQRCLALSAPLWRNAADGPLTSLRRQLQLTSEVRYIVHSGGDAYAVATTAGDVKELDRRSDPNAVALIERIAHVLAPYVLYGANPRPLARPARHASGSWLAPNPRRSRNFRSPVFIRPKVMSREWPNALPGRLGRAIPNLQRPNELRRCS